MKKLLDWFDKHILTIVSLFLFLFIPLYPKLPLMELIPGYIVRVRLEDFFFLFAFLLFLVQALRGKAVLKNILFKPIIIYLGVGFLSVVSAIFFTKTIPMDKLHIGKAFLHWVRRIEYFSLFFIFYNGIKKAKDLKLFTVLSGVLIVFIAGYGYGQKYLYWPVFSTMNREFSKGVRLYLTEHARVPSTFGGHYDLAAFLVIFLIFFVSFFVLLKKKKYKLPFLVFYLVSYWLLILSASRTSFIAYVAGLAMLFFVLSFKQGWIWGASRGMGFIVFSFLIMIFFGDLSDRFAHLLNLPEFREKYKLDKLLQPLKPPPVSVGYKPVDEDIPLVVDITDERPVKEKPTASGGKKGLPPDVYEDIPDGYEEVTVSGEGDEERTVSKPKSRTFSDNAYKYGLSAAIRLDALWPRAIDGFLSNPLLGSGYSTLTKETRIQFTEAESTDNDYLRALGETGLLGFLSFFAIIFIALRKVIWSLKREKDRWLLALKSSYIAFSFGLLVNALYIDVFEASKVAFMFWALTGVILAVVEKDISFLKTKK